MAKLHTKIASKQAGGEVSSDNSKCPKCGGSDFYTYYDAWPATSGNSLLVDRAFQANIAKCAYCLVDFEPRVRWNETNLLLPSETELEEGNQFFLQALEAFDSEGIETAFPLFIKASNLGFNRAVETLLEKSLETDRFVEEAMKLYQVNRIRFKEKNWQGNSSYRASFGEANKFYGLCMLKTGSTPIEVRDFWEKNEKGSLEIYIAYLTNKQIPFDSFGYWYNGWIDFFREKSNSPSKWYSELNKGLLEFFTKFIDNRNRAMELLTESNEIYSNSGPEAAIVALSESVDLGNIRAMERLLKISLEENLMISESIARFEKTFVTRQGYEYTNNVLNYGLSLLTSGAQAQKVLDIWSSVDSYNCKYYANFILEEILNLPAQHELNYAYLPWGLEDTLKTQTKSPNTYLANFSSRMLAYIEKNKGTNGARDT